MDKLPKIVQEEINILSKMYEETSPRDYTLKSLIMTELKGYLRALEHMGLITKNEKIAMIHSVV